MATNASFSNMLNENVYNSLQKEKAAATDLTSKRESIRNKLIDQLGRKPTEEEIDAILLSSEG